MTLDAALASDAGIAAERVDSLRREHVERAVLRMFTWRAGQFSFEVRDEMEARDLELSLPTGINAQYLTMEASRLRDEKGAPDARRCSPRASGTRIRKRSPTKSRSSAARSRPRRSASRGARRVAPAGRAGAGRARGARARDRAQRRAHGVRGREPRRAGGGRAGGARAARS